MVCPRIQWFGSGFGQNGSTSKRGAVTPAASTAACFCSKTLATTSVASRTRKIAPTYRLRFMLPPFWIVVTVYVGGILYQPVGKKLRFNCGYAGHSAVGLRLEFHDLVIVDNVSNSYRAAAHFAVFY